MIATQLTQLDPSAKKGLCLQFILHEYAKALKIASSFSSANPQKILNGIQELYPDLTDGLPTIRLGILRNLCFYCEALLENSQKGEKLLNELDDLQLIASRERRNKKPSSLLFEKLCAIFPLLSDEISKNWDNEVVLFSLLELRKSLNEHLGKNCVEELLQKHFESPFHLREIISNGFLQRGFNGFNKQHETLFEGLTWTPSQMKR